MVRNCRGEISGIFPSFLVPTPLRPPRLVSVPFSDYGGPLFADPEVGRRFQDVLVQARDRLYGNMELRGEVQTSDTPLFVRTNYYKRHILQLDKNPENLLKIIDKRTIQYSIRKARKSGVTVREDNTEQGMKEFYRLNVLTRRKHGVPSQPFRFFMNLWKNLINGGKGFLLLAEHEGAVVAGSLYLCHRETVYYKFNASDPDCLTTITPNHLVTWHAIEAARGKGYNYLDFGRTSPDNEGLIRYKELWGAKGSDLPYYYFPAAQGASSTEEKSLSYRVFSNAWRLLPDSWAESLSPRIYGYFG